MTLSTWSQEHLDAGFYEAVHGLLEAAYGKRGSERRDDRRREYRCVQLMAPYDGRTLPTQSDFRQVRCHDISPKGFSFTTAEPPDCELLVVALGPIPFTFLTARVVHVSKPDAGRRGRYVVGCRFTGRIGVA